MNKFLFLDFDGVLHPATLNDNSELFSKNKLLEQTFLNLHCNIVISSSWRFHHSFDSLKNKLPAEVRRLIVGVTGDPYIGQFSRFNEIIEYLKEIKSISADWISLDDSYYEFPPNCPNLIRCNPNTGMSFNESILLKNWLEKQTINI